MVEINYKYKCDKCDKLFKHLGDYKKHLKRKKPCQKVTPIGGNDINLSIISPIKPPDNVEIFKKVNDNIILSNLSSEVDNILSPLECYACGKVFTRKDNLVRHLDKVCTAKNKIKNNTKEIELINELFNKISIMEKKMSEMYQNNDKNNKNNDKNAEIVIGNNTLSNNNNINNINTNNNNNINNIANTNYDIKIIAFGEENLYDRISDDLAKEFISNGYQSVIQLVDYVHFNKDHPELQNVYISNKKIMLHKYLMDYIGKID